METEGAAKKMILDDSEPASCCTKPAKEEQISAPCCICAYKGLDSGSCGTCIAKAAALDRIKVAGGDSVKAAKDYTARVASSICVVQAVAPAVPEEGKAEPVGIVRKKKMVVDAAHVEMLMNGPPRAPLRTLSEHYFDDDDEDDPNCREDIVAGASLILACIEQEENILTQFINKGYAEVELEIDYGC